MAKRDQRGCLKDGIPTYRIGDYITRRCPKRFLLDNPWIGSAWAAQELVTLDHANKAHDTVGALKAADAWRQNQEMEEIRSKSR